MDAATIQNVLWIGPNWAGSVGFAMPDQRSDYMSSFGAQLRARRLEAGYTDRAKLAELVPISEATFGRWENGLLLPDLWELREICRVLAIEPTELIYPEPLSERERLVQRRGLRAVRKASAPKRRASGGHA
jgi:transcriptional regulator with XRE-family HTH domain